MSELPGSLRELAAQVGCSAQTIANWRRGTKTPEAQYRARIHTAWGIPPEAWDVAPHTELARSAAPATAAADQLPATNGHTVPLSAAVTTLEGCLELLGLLRTERSKPGLLAAERVRLADTEARILALRHRLEREQELLEDRIVREHPRWQMLRRTLVKVLAKYPDAARAVLAALSEFDTVTSVNEGGGPVESETKDRSGVHAS